MCLAVVAFTTGCSTVSQTIGAATGTPSEPEWIPHEQLDGYESVQALLDAHYEPSYEVKYSTVGRARLLEPYLNTRMYCQRQQGNWVRVESMPGPQLPYKPTADYERVHRDAYERDVAAVFGTFHCQRQDAPLWGITIQHSGGRDFSPEGRVGRANMWVIPLTSDDIAIAKAEELVRQQDEERLAEARKAERAERARASYQYAREQRQRIESAAAALREDIGLGTETHCGMVVQLRESLVEVQTVVGQRWFRLNQLYPPATLECRFINGQYVEP